MEIVGNFENASKLLSEDTCSQLFLESKKHHLKLAPKYLGNLKSGISAHLTCFLSRYDKDFGGVPIAFKNVKVKQSVGRIIADQACVHLDIVADFIVFRPVVGCTLKGKINKVAQRHVSCLVHDCFNAWMLQCITTQKMAADKLMGTDVQFEVQDIYTKDNLMSLKGKFLNLLTKEGAIDEVTDLLMSPPVKKPKKRKKKKPNASTLSDAGNTSSIIEDGNETILAKGGSYDNVLDDSLDNSTIEPLIASTQVNEQGQDLTGKTKKRKKKKGDKSMNNSVGDEKSQESVTVTNDSIDVAKNETVDEMNGSMTKSHKKKKKREKSMDNSVGDEKSQKSVSVTNDSIDIAIKNETVDEMNESMTKKQKKKKRGEKGMDNSVGDEKSQKSVSVTNDSIDIAIKNETVDEMNESMTKSHKKKKKKHRKDMEESVDKTQLMNGSVGDGSKLNARDKTDDSLLENEISTDKIRKSGKRKLSIDASQLEQSVDTTGDLFSPKKKHKKHRKQNGE